MRERCIGRGRVPGATHGRKRRLLCAKLRISFENDKVVGRHFVPTTGRASLWMNAKKDSTRRHDVWSLDFLFVVMKKRFCLLTQAECLHDGAIALDVAILQVVEEGAALTYEFHERAFGRMIFTVCSHVFRQVGNTV